MPYKTPTLVEIIAQVDFEESCNVACLLDVVQHLREHGFPEVEMHRQDRLALGQQELLAIGTEMFRCWAPDRKSLIQLTPTYVGYNQVGDYLGWRSFSSAFQELLKLTCSGWPHPATLTHITRDSLKASSEGFRLGQYLHCGGPLIPALFANVCQAWDLNWGWGIPGKDEENTQFLASVRPRKQKMVLNTAITKVKKVDDWNRLGDVLESLHLDVVRLFEDSITDFVRAEIMGGKC